jgi:hypothetical protein
VHASRRSAGVLRGRAGICRFRAAVASDLRIGRGPSVPVEHGLAAIDASILGTWVVGQMLEERQGQRRG